MVGIAVNLLHRTALDDAPRVHHVDLLRQSGDDTQVVGDPDDGHSQFVAQPLDKLDDLRLDGHVERGRRLVRDEDRRVAGKRHRDHGPLSHATGELMGVVIQPLGCLGNTHHRQQLPCPIPGLFVTHALVQLEGLHDLKAHSKDRVE